MDLTQHTSPLIGDRDARLPAAAYLRYETRADGWSPGRQAAFLSHLADHGLVADAARCVGMSQAGGYALRRSARGYAFNLGWEAALIIARRIVADNLMAAAIRGEESRWVREEGITTYTRQNTRLSLALLDRVNPAAALPEVLAVATGFDTFLQLIDDGVSAEGLWENFFDRALPHSEKEARARVRVSLQLCEDSAAFEEMDRGEEEPPIEYKSIDAGQRSVGKLSRTKPQSHKAGAQSSPPRRRGPLDHRAPNLPAAPASAEVTDGCRSKAYPSFFSPSLRGFVASCEINFPAPDRHARLQKSRTKPQSREEGTQSSPRAHPIGYMISRLIL